MIPRAGHRDAEAQFLRGNVLEEVLRNLLQPWQTLRRTGRSAPGMLTVRHDLDEIAYLPERLQVEGSAPVFHHPLRVRRGTRRILRPVHDGNADLATILVQRVGRLSIEARERVAV